jgi:heme oxygenase
MQPNRSMREDHSRQVLKQAGVVSNDDDRAARVLTTDTAPGPPTSARFHLRQVTASRHRAVELAMATDAPMTLRSYRRCLSIFYGVFAPTETVLAQWSVTSPLVWIVEPKSARASCDLMEMGVSPLDTISTIQTIAPVTHCGDGADGAAQALGYAYVLEGAAFGAEQLARRVRAELPGAPVTFLTQRDRGRWLRFTAALNSTLDTELLRERAGTAAQSIFDSLEALARRLPRE